MAAPTNVFAEATSISTIVLRWTYPGASDIAVYRSLDGSSYSEITSLLFSTRVTPGTTTYTSTELSTGTKYWYKLSDDAGSTFSSVVTAYTHACPGDSSEQATTPLPKFLEDIVEPAKLNEMARRIEDALSNVTVAPESCIACPVDGAVVVDCSTGCRNWTVVADQNINSVSINWCNQFDGRVDFVIPPNTDVLICGFPASFGFSGGECKDVPLSGGPNGRTMGLFYNGGGGAGGTLVNSGTTGSRPSTGSGSGRTSGTGAGGGGGGGGGSGCTCVTQNGALVIKSCRANNSLDCAGTKSLTLIACGGQSPYEWSKTGTVKIAGNGETAGSTATGSTITVTPPSNSGTAVAGEAYRVVFCSCTSGNTNVFLYRSFKCDDAAFNSPNCGEASAASPMLCNNGNINTCCSLTLTCNGDGTGGGCTCGSHTSGASPCTRCSNNLPAGGQLCDLRTGSMISDGCTPCGLVTGDIVTVTDALGTSVSVVITA